MAYAAPQLGSFGGTDDKDGSAPDVVVFDLAERTITRVSHARNRVGDSANGPSYDATFSPANDTVAFTSEASNIARSDTNERPDVFLASFVEDDDPEG